MSTERSIEQLVADALRLGAPASAPDTLTAAVLHEARRAHRRPRWLALLLERPMTRPPTVLVGSPVLRTASLVLAVVLTALAFGLALVAGGALPRRDLAAVVPTATVAPTPTAVPASATPIPTDRVSSPSMPTIGRFIPAGSLVEGRAWHSALALPDGRVLLVGGEGSHVAHGSRWLDSIELWDPASGSFTASGQMQRATYGFQTEGPHLFRMTEGRVMLIPTGCVCGPAPASTPAQVWDQVSGVRLLVTLRVRRVAYTATQLADGRILIAGGVPGLKGDELATAEVWDPVAGTVKPTGALSFARADAAATLLTDGRVLIVGGGVRSDGATPPDEAEIWDPASGTFSTAFTHEFGPGGSPGHGLRLVALTLPDGRVLLLDDAGAHIWDPVDNTFSAAGTYREARGQFTATRLADGRVLVAGGSREVPGDGSAAIASTEIWDPSIGGFEPGPDLLEARAGHTATLLPDGRVLIVGGFRTAGSALDALASAEVWVPAAADGR